METQRSRQGHVERLRNEAEQFTEMEMTRMQLAVCEKYEETQIATRDEVERVRMQEFRMYMEMSVLENRYRAQIEQMA